MKKSFPRVFFLILVGLITTIFFGLVFDFMLSIFWAIIFAILFRPRYIKILGKMPNRPNTASVFTILLIIVIVILPVITISTAIYLESNEIVTTITESKNVLEDQVKVIQKNIPLDRKQMRSLGLTTRDIEKKIIELKNKGTGYLAGKAISFSQNIFSVVINFFLMIYVLFYFLRDGRRVIQQLRWVVPMKDDLEERILDRFESVARATVKGSLVVALIQGSIGGITFYFLDIPAAFLWGAIMVIASLLPVGSVIVWGPWMMIFLSQGNFFKGMILLVVGTLFIGLIDNLLRPRLVGQDSKMSDYMVLISTLGGLSWVGLSGFVIGPIIAALFTTLWYMVGQEFADKEYEDVVTEPSVQNFGKTSDLNT